MSNSLRISLATWPIVVMRLEFLVFDGLSFSGGSSAPDRQLDDGASWVCHLVSSRYHRGVLQSVPTIIHCNEGEAGSKFPGPICEKFLILCTHDLNVYGIMLP